MATAQGLLNLLQLLAPALTNKLKGFRLVLCLAAFLMFLCFLYLTENPINSIKRIVNIANNNNNLSGTDKEKTTVKNNNSNIKTTLETKGTSKNHNAFKQPQIARSNFYKSYPYHDKYSKRYNISTNVKPRNILRSSGNFTDLSKFGTLKHVPRIIHQTNKKDMIPVLYQVWMQSWLKLNPHWEYWYWSDKDLNNFIDIRYPDFKHIFYGYKHGVERSDVFRYFVLYEFGGVYADLDMECLKPMDVKMDEHDCLLSVDPPLHSIFMYKDRKRLVSNAFMACRPRHPYFKYVIDNLTNNNRHKMDNPVRTTGPFMLDDYLNEIEKHTNESLPFIADSDEYQPAIDPRGWGMYANFCKKQMGKFHKMKNPKRAETICNHYLKDGWYKEPRNVSYAVHRFTHSWNQGFEKDKYGQHGDFRTFNITNLLN